VLATFEGSRQHKRILLLLLTIGIIHHQHSTRKITAGTLVVCARKTCVAVANQQINTNALTEHIPIILFSAYLHPWDALTDSVADDFLTKPFHLDTQLTLVQKYLP
jgi:response regulator RpfG family c-di-GMP phosphodiesterase